jgi:hypothetical protein
VIENIVLKADEFDKLEFKKTGTFADTIIYRLPDKPSEMYLLKQGHCEGTGRYYSGMKITFEKGEPFETRNS